MTNLLNHPARRVRQAACNKPTQKASVYEIVDSAYHNQSSAHSLPRQQVDQLLFQEQVSSTSSPGTLYTAITDHLQSVREAVNTSGTSVGHVNYDSFGRRVSVTGTVPAFGYTGKLFDGSTGLQYNWHRWYDSSIGKWMSEDPIGFDGETDNLREYVGNSPTNRSDPSGLRPFGVAPLTYTPGVTFQSINGPKLLNPALDFDAGDASHGQWGAKFEFTWQVKPAAFFDNVAMPIVCKLVMIQIYKTKLVLRNGSIRANAAAWKNSNDWALDKGLEYPFPTGRNTITNPWKPMAGSIGQLAYFQDLPNTGPYFDDFQIELYEVQFEVHVVAKGGSLGGLSFGGFKWGIRFDYEESRYLPGNLSRHFWKQPVTQVSQEYRNIVEPRIERSF